MDLDLYNNFHFGVGNVHPVSCASYLAPDVRRYEVQYSKTRGVTYYFTTLEMVSVLPLPRLCRRTVLIEASIFANEFQVPVDNLPFRPPRPLRARGAIVRPGT